MPDHTTEPTYVGNGNTAPYFVSYAVSGLENGLDRQVFDSCVLQGPATGFNNIDELKELANALAFHFFQSNKWTELRVVPLMIQKLQS